MQAVSNIWAEPNQGFNSCSTSKDQLVSKTSQVQNLHIKKITSDEMEIRRRQGLCYYCIDKFSPGHKCKPKQLCSLSGEGDEEAPTKNSMKKKKRKVHQKGKF